VKRADKEARDRLVLKLGAAGLAVSQIAARVGMTASGVRGIFVRAGARAPFRGRGVRPTYPAEVRGIRYGGGAR
jgi:hypothetical protein